MMNASTMSSLLASMEAELKRSMRGLRAPGHPRPYYISYLLRHIELYDIEAKYGALFKQQIRPVRNLYADVRVGSYRFDQTTRGGLGDNSDDDESEGQLTMPLEDDPEALRHAIWRLTDTRYREAVSHYHDRKSSNISLIDENKDLASFQRQGPLISTPAPSPDAVDMAHFSEFVREASRELLRYPAIKDHEMSFSARRVTRLFVNSEGRRLVWQTGTYTLSLFLWHLTKSGEGLSLSLRYTTASPKELPDLAAYLLQIKERVHLLEEIAAAEPLVSYSGPVLLAPLPAGLFLHEVLGHRLEGNRMLSDNEGKTFKDKTGQKITFEGLSLFDDPTIPSFRGRSLIGHYAFDDEGTEARRADLVEQGVLRGFLTTRAPLKKRGHEPNGHARNRRHQRPISRMGSLFIEPEGGKPWEELKAMLLAEIKRRKLPFGIMILEAKGGETDTGAYNFQAFLGRVTIAKKIFPDGQERYIRGVNFVGTPLSSLSHIVAVGKDLAVDNGFCGAESGTIPVSTISPALLVSSLELQAKEQRKVTQFLLPLPWE